MIRVMRRSLDSSRAGCPCHFVLFLHGRDARATSGSKMPWAAHGLVDQAVGFFVVFEALGGGVELEVAAELDGDLGDVDEGAGAVAVLFVEGEFSAGFDGLEEVG